ncbi:hypothetical protein FACS18949_10000 [Clostridia bacterium]|nr:hypothetical protein FACS18949_10000 [Clostridia bacterium]
MEKLKIYQSGANFAKGAGTAVYVIGGLLGAVSLFAGPEMIFSAVVTWFSAFVLGSAFIAAHYIIHNQHEMMKLTIESIETVKASAEFIVNHIGEGRGE